ncbi:MAG: class I SAM-dependent rRNA methyltransferase [Lachnospiraceae bacterium]|nr:class I SAM-dependent rRNA methyltransferase [Lachnospiraceae bacterium]
MKQKREFPSVTVTKKQEFSIRNGHPWVYEDELTQYPERVENGSLVDVFGQKGNYLGTGFWSGSSKIRIRILDHNANEKFDEAFFARRAGYAISYRRDVMSDDFSACRLVHGEADGLPGLTIDRYGDLLVSEVLSYGTDLHKKTIYEAIVHDLEASGESISGLYERNEGELRKKEGLEQYKGWYDLEGKPHPDSVITEITENGIRYEVDVENGQKTGFFLDQKYNRLAVRKLARGKNVLDCCTHTGSFALNAAAGGAASVTAVDISDTALKMAEANAERNGMKDKLSFVQADLFDLLPRLIEEHAHYNFIILDPPAFTKSRRTFQHAKSGYQKINTMAMRLLPRGGYLATASCSHFMPTEEFREILKVSAQEAGVTLRIIEERHAAPDHPVIAAIPETDYLKFFLLQIL